MLINTFHNDNLHLTQNTPCRVVATPSFRNSVDKPSTLAGLCFVMRTKKELEKLIELPGEEYRPVVGFEGLYEVSNFGNVRSIGHMVKGCYGSTQYKPGIQKIKIVDRYGYLTVRMTKDRYTNNYTIHRLVATAFIPNPENLPAINHKFGNKEDNRVEMLEWCTTKDNMQHASKTGLLKHLKGELSPTSKTTNEQKIEIYTLFMQGISPDDIAARFGISRRNVHYTVKKSPIIKEYLKHVKEGNT